MYRPKKYLSQVFLKDKSIIDSIIHHANVKQDDEIIEIGPGFGALTKPILKLTRAIRVIELDKDLVVSLQNSCSKYGKIFIYQKNILDVDLNRFYHNKKMKLIGNLPYNITSPILFYLIDYAHLFGEVYFMVQKEVMDRITSKPSEKSYGRLSIMLQCHFKCEALFTIPATAFYPKPKVESGFLRLIPYEKPPFLIRDYSYFSKIVKEAFQMRRKTLRNNFKKIFTEKQLEKLPVNLSLRPENLSIDKFVELSNCARG